LNGVLVDPSHATTEAWTATAGYDMTSGLGTLNVNNLSTNWGTVSTIGTTTALTLSPTTGITHGTSENVTVGVTVAPTTGTTAPTGDVSLIATFPDGTTQGLDHFTLTNGAISGATTKSLPGGSYNVSAHYAGDGTNAPSDSTPIQMTIGKESSQAFIIVPTFTSTGGSLTNGNASSFVYGTPYIIRMYVTDKNGVANPTGPPSPTCLEENEITCPTGTVSLTANGSPVDGGVFSLNNAGYTRDIAPTLGGGTYQLSAQYSGDNSFLASASATPTLTITPAPTFQQWTNSAGSVVVNQPFALGVVVDTGVAGVSPTGAVTFLDGNTPLPGTVTYMAQGQNSNVVLYANITTTISTGGAHTLTASYSGDSNYGPSTSSPVGVVAKYQASIAQSESATSINYGQSIAVTAVVTGNSKGPALAGLLQFSGSYTPINNPITLTSGTDANGNPTLTATVSTTPLSSEQISVTYSNDPNYVGGTFVGDFITVNIPDFSLPIPPPITVTAGQTSTTVINVTPTSGTPSPVTMSPVGGLPGGMSLTFNPPIANLNGAPVPVTVTLTTIGPSGSAPSVVSTQSKMFLTPETLNGWRVLSLAGALVMLCVAGIAGKQRRYRVAFAASFSWLLALAFGCGGGGATLGGGGGGGGGGSPAPTSISITTSNAKVPSSGGSFTVTATVTSTSSKPITGTVIFNAAQLAFPYPNGVPVVNGVASYTANVGQGSLQFPVGTYAITALYSGDANNLPSQDTAGVNEVFTGTTQLTIAGQTGSLSHQTNVTVTLQ
jgi:hypothetical protein